MWRRSTGVRDLDARTFFFYYATGITPAMAGSSSVWVHKKPLDGSKTYKLHLPPDIPAKDFLVDRGL